MALLDSVKQREAIGGVKTPVTSATATPSTLYITSNALRRGVKSEEVKLLQQALNKAGYSVGAVDGSYGPATEAAVRAYQKANKLSVDGIAGQQTLGSLKLVQPSAQAPSVQAPKTTTPVPGIKPSQQTPGAVTDSGTNTGYTPKVPVDQLGIKPSQQLPGAVTDSGTGGLDNRVNTPVQGAFYGVKPSQQGQGGMETDTGTNATPQRQEPERQTSGGATGAYSQGTSPTTTGVGGASTGAGSIGSELRPTIEGGQVQQPSGAGQQGEQAGQPAFDISPITNELQVTDSMIADAEAKKQQYIDLVNNAVFEYDPTQDPEYLRQASAYENTIVQMMVGRGGLYSSVTQSGIQSSLINLQMELRAQRYESFVADRNFNMSMAKFYSGEQDKFFRQQMDLLDYQMAKEKFAFDVAKEEFDQQLAIAGYNLDVKRLELDYQKEQFDQQMAVANYNASRQAEANSLAMRRQELQFRIDQENNRILMDQLDMQMEQQRSSIYSAAEIVASEREKGITASFQNLTGLEVFLRRIASYINSHMSKGTIKAGASLDVVYPILRNIENSISQQSQIVVNSMNEYGLSKEMTDQVKRMYTVPISGNRVHRTVNSEKCIRRGRQRCSDDNINTKQVPVSNTAYTAPPAPSKKESISRSLTSSVAQAQ